MFKHAFIFGQNVRLPTIDICPGPNLRKYVCSYVYTYVHTCHIQHYTASNDSTSGSTSVHSVIIIQCNISDHKISESSSSRVEYWIMIRYEETSTSISHFDWHSIPTPYSRLYSYCIIRVDDNYHTLHCIVTLFTYATRTSSSLSEC